MGKFASVLQAVITRLNYHAVTGRILEGFTISTDIQKEVIGSEDFPRVTVFLANPREEKHGELLRLELRVNMIVSVWNNASAVELLQAVEKVADAVQTATDGSGRRELGFGGTAVAMGPIEYSNESALANSLSTDLTMVIKAQASDIADRRN